MMFDVAMQIGRNVWCCYIDQTKKLKRKLFLGNFKTLWPLLWMGFNCLKAIATSRRQFTFYHSVPRNSWYSFYRPWKDDRLSRPWSHPVFLNTGPLDWESSTLTTRPLLHKPLDHCSFSINLVENWFTWQVVLWTPL